MGGQGWKRRWRMVVSICCALFLYIAVSWHADQSE